MRIWWRLRTRVQFRASTTLLDLARLRVGHAARNSRAHAVVECASGRVFIGRRQMSWQIHAVVKQPQDIDV